MNITPGSSVPGAQSSAGAGPRDLGLNTMLRGNKWGQPNNYVPTNVGTRPSNVFSGGFAGKNELLQKINTTVALSRSRIRILLQPYLRLDHQHHQHQNIRSKIWSVCTSPATFRQVWEVVLYQLRS